MGENRDGQHPSVSGQWVKYIVVREGKIVHSAECYDEPFPLRWFLQEQGSIMKPGDELYAKVQRV